MLGADTETFSGEIGSEQQVEEKAHTFTLKKRKNHSVEHECLNQNVCFVLHLKQKKECISGHASKKKKSAMIINGEVILKVTTNTLMYIYLLI